MGTRLSKEYTGEVLQTFDGKRFAFAAVVCDGGFGIGVTVMNEPGYTPINPYHYHADSFDAASDEAERLNSEALRLSPGYAMKIVASTMAPQERRWTKVPANRLWGLICALGAFRGNALAALDVSEKFAEELEASLNMVHAMQAELRAMAKRRDYEAIAASLNEIARGMEGGLKSASHGVWTDED